MKDSKGWPSAIKDKGYDPKRKEKGQDAR